MNEPIESIRKSVAVTPNDSTDITPARGILVGSAGNVKVTYADKDATVDTVYLAAGVWHPMYIRRVWAAGTTATGIHAGY